MGGIWGEPKPNEKNHFWLLAKRREKRKERGASQKKNKRRCLDGKKGVRNGTPEEP